MEASAEAFLMRAWPSVPASSIPAAFARDCRLLPKEANDITWAASPATGAVVIVSVCHARIRS